MAHYSRIPEISLDGYQVVKGDMFIHFPRKSEATCTLWPTSISFNKMALQTLNNCERIRIEINPKTKGMLLFPVTAQDKDGIRWTKGVKDPVARKIECKAFATQLYEVWGLDSTCVYVAAGKIVTADKKALLLFDFSNAESWRAKSKAK